MFFSFGDTWVASHLTLDWVPKRGKIQCLLKEWSHGNWGWNSQWDFPPESPISLVLVVGDGRQWLFHDGKRILSVEHIWPTDCCLLIWSETPDSAVIHRCSIRPLSPGDVVTCGWPTPPTDLPTAVAEERARLTRIAGEAGGAKPTAPVGRGEASERFDRISQGYRSLPKAGEPFVLETSRTPMAWIPPGEFEMGSHAQNPQAKAALHRVRLTRGYWMAQVETTQGEYSKVTGSNPSRVTGSLYLPVDWVAWDEAVAYCRKLTAIERTANRLPAGYEYRLPTEAEWEYACRAGSNEAFSVPPTSVFSRATSGRRPHEVAEYAPNRWGLYDMHGNAMEWCLDRWREYPKEKREVTVDPLMIGGPDNDPFVVRRGDNFVVRGGAWWSAPGWCASHWRYMNGNNSNGFRGFRIVLGPRLGKVDPDR